MGFLFGLFVTFVIAFCIFVVYVIHISKKDQHDATFTILSKLVRIGMLVIILTQVVVLVVSLFNMQSDLIITLAVSKQILTTTFYILIYLELIKLLDNLAKKEIFTYKNSDYTKKIGLLFLYLSLAEIICGLLAGLVVFSSYGSFNITVSLGSSVFVYVIIGLALQVIAWILKIATDIYEENQLTI